jgi:hypothetical protein
MNDKVFISHIHEDDDQVGSMTALLAEHGHEVSDSSVTKDEPNAAKSPNYIKYGILAPRIQWAEVLVVLVSPGMRESIYVDWEIEYAKQLGKRIVGVWAQGGSEDDVPDALDRYADAVVGWQGQRIQDAIEGKIDNWEKSDGDLRPVRDIARHNC